MATEHILKTLPPYWDALASRAKNFEVRRDDRGFQKGDTLLLRKAEEDGRFVFRHVNGSREVCEVRKRISYVLTGGQFGIEPGFVVMGLQDVE